MVQVEVEAQDLLERQEQVDQEIHVEQVDQEDQDHQTVFQEHQ